MKNVIYGSVELMVNERWDQLSVEAQQDLVDQVKRGMVKPVMVDSIGLVIEGEEVLMAAIQAKVKSLTFIVVAAGIKVDSPSIPAAGDTDEATETSPTILKVTAQQCQEWSRSQAGSQPVVAKKLDRFCVFATTPAELKRVLEAMREIEPSQLANRKTTAKSLIRLARAQKAKRLLTQTIKELAQPGVELHFGDFRTIGAGISDNSIDGVFTDPPYDEASIELYYESAVLAKRILKPGGIYIAYAGKMFLSQVYAALERSGLEFVWQCAIMHNGGHNVTWPRRMISAYKPILIYRKPGSEAINWPLVVDVCREGKQEQHLHPWQQAIAESEYFIRSFFDENSIILDPMCGSGTVLVAGIKCGVKRVIGFEQDPVTFETAKKRVEDHLAEVQLPAPIDPGIQKEGA